MIIMPRKLTIISSVFFLLLLVSCRPAPPRPSSSLPDPSHWKLVFSDEFSGDKLDTTKWNTCYPWVEEGGCTNSGNHELEWYQPDDVIVENGLLRLRAQDRTAKEGFPYTSGMVTTHQKFSFQYGYVEACFRVPAGQGLWPALWLLPEDEHWPPEIDIHEVLGNQPTTIHTTLHYTTDGKNHFSSGTSWKGPDFSADFHTIGLLWEPHLIAWTIDGVERYAVTEDIPQEPFYLLANLAVGGDWPGSPNASTIFPSFYDIDYIRIYENASYMITAAAPTLTPSGGKNIVYAAKIRVVDEYGIETKSVMTGTISWQVQVVDQDGTPYSGARITAELLGQDGNVKQLIPNWEPTDRLGWVTFTTFIKEPGTYTIHVTDIDVISINVGYNPQKNTKPLKITVK
jgi:beta-glucanase (GH16 family)